MKYSSIRVILNGDSLMCIVKYLKIFDIIQLFSIQKKTNEKLRGEYVWKTIVDSYIAPIQSGENKIEAWMNEIRSTLEIPTMKGVVQAFWRIDRPLLSQWRMIPQDFASDFAGDFVSIYLSSDVVERSLIGESCDASGQNRIIIFQIEYTEIAGRGELEMVTADTLERYKIRTEDGMLKFRSQGSNQLRVYRPIPQSNVADIQDSHIRECVNDCLGLVVAPYGSHGLELLNVSLHTTTATVAGIEAHPLINVPLRLEGLKVLGDANVPAAQLSFVADLTQSVDIDQALATDTRIIVAFPINADAMIVDMEIRRPLIKAWYRGIGQINRIPGVWDPQWVGGNLIIYEAANNIIGNIKFSILWNDLEYTSRHIIDYKKFSLNTI